LKIGQDHRRQLGRGLAIMTITMGGGSGQILLSPFLRSQHKDPVMIGALVAVVAVASLAIRIPGGLLYSRTRARPLLLGSLAMCALAFSLYPVTANPGLLAVIGVVYGTGFSVATTVNMAASIESLRPGENRGRGRAEAIVMPMGRGGFGRALETVLRERPCRVIIESVPDERRQGDQAAA